MGYPERVEGAAGVYARRDAERHTAALAALSARWERDGLSLWACLDGDGRCVGFSGACGPGAVLGREHLGCPVDVYAMATADDREVACR